MIGKHKTQRLVSNANFLLLFLAIVILLSCQTSFEISPTSEVPHKNELVGADHITQVKYATFHLKTIGEKIAVLGRESSFRGQLYNEIEKRFDGETNTLVKTLLLNASRSNGRNSLSMEEVIEQSLGAFQGIEGENFYPQIFIPFYDQLKAENQIGIGSPVIVIGVEDVPLADGYILDDKNQLIKLDSKVTEEFARQNEVWVISINERVDDEGNTDYYEPTTQPSSRVQGLTYPNAVWNPMTITVHKESWIAGASEINVKRFLSWYTFDQYSPGVPFMKKFSSQDAPEDGSGIKITEFSRDDVDSRRAKNINWTYVPNWPDQVYEINSVPFHTDYLYYIIFEYDAWPTGERETPLRDATDTEWAKNRYRSADIYYIKGYIPEYAANVWSVNQDGIITTSSY